MLTLLMVSVFTGLSPVKGIVGVSYIIVHALNPEGIEIASIEGVKYGKYSVGIFDEDTLIGYGAHDIETYNKPIAINSGAHTIKVRFNGMTLQQSITLVPGEIKALVFTFSRTEISESSFFSGGIQVYDSWFFEPVDISSSEPIIYWHRQTTNRRGFGFYYSDSSSPYDWSFALLETKFMSYRYEFFPPTSTQFHGVAVVAGDWECEEFKFSSVPYDLTGTGIKHEEIQPPKVRISMIRRGDWCPDLSKPKNGDIDGDGRTDWFYRSVTDSLGRTIGLYGMDRSWLHLSDYFALIWNGMYLIGKCVFYNGENDGWVEYNRDNGQLIFAEWTSIDEGSDDVGNLIWLDWEAVEGKDRLVFEFFVEQNVLRVTHYDEEGEVIERAVGPPGIPGGSWIWNSELVPELPYREDDVRMTSPSLAVDFDPDTLNLRSKGKWLTAYIQLPEEYDPDDIDATTILLNATIQPVLDPKYDFVTNSSEYLIDHNEDGILERMVKFNRTEIEDLLPFVNEATTLELACQVGINLFKAQDMINVRRHPN